MGKIFNKGLSKDDQKEGLFKKLKNIEDKNEKKLKAIEDKKQLDTNLKSISYFSQSSTMAKELLEKITQKRNDIDPEKFICVKTNATIFNFNKFKNSLDLASNIYRNKKLLKDEENKQSEIKILLNKLRKYNPTKLKKINAKEETLSAAEKLLNKRQEVIDAFKTDIEYIENESKEINYELFKKYFNFIVPSALAKKLYKTKDAKENSELVEEIRNRWSNLKDEVKKMSEDEKEIE